MPTRNVVLTDQQERFIADLVTAGRYQNASEVMRDALRLLDQQIERRQAEIDGIRAGILKGLRDEAHGRFAEGGVEDIVRRAFGGRSARSS